MEVGNIFKLGTRYSEALGCIFTDASGQSRPVIMGSYGIGARAAAGLHRRGASRRARADLAGQRGPVPGAPGPAGVKDGPERAGCRALYQDLLAAGIEPLYDDRAESAGVKFNDADLIGLPLRLTVGERSLKNGGVELKRRTGSEIRTVPLDEAVEQVQVELERKLAALAISFWLLAFC